MLTLLLVDDEPIILQGFLETYDWNKMGFQVIGTARDGEKALELMEKQEPDLILTDVRMKKMNGLELIEKSKELGYQTKFVVISAYKDFEYAKKACKNGALSYLVKPIDDVELESTMTRIFEECSDEKDRKRNYNLWEQILLEDRDNFLNQMVGKYLDDSIEETELMEFFVSLSRETELEDHFAVICADIDITHRVINQQDFDMKQYLLDSQLQKELREKYHIWTQKSIEGIPCYIVNMGSNDSNSKLKLILTGIRNELKTDLISAISSVEEGLAGIKNAYIKTLQLFEVACEAGAGLLVLNNNIEMKCKIQYSIDIESQMLGAIRKNNAEQLKEAYKKFIFSLPSDEITSKIYIRRLVAKIEFVLQDSNWMTEGMIQSFKNFYKSFEKVTLLKLIDVLYQLLLATLEIKKKTKTTADEYFKEYIYQATAYIQEHLQEETLSITNVSEYIYLNPVYFGRVFKNIMNTPFKKYVQNVRMEKAKELLAEGQESITNICTKVGIPNPSYFAQIFKQYTGVLPREYVRSFNNEK